MENIESVQVLGVKRTRPLHCVDGRKTKVPRLSAPKTGPVIQGYKKFMKSKRPRRVMFFHGGEWCDFPNDAMLHLVDAFVMRNSVVEISMENSNYLIDFVQMIMIDLKAESQQSIAWIDEEDKCFFPMYSFDRDCKFDEIGDDIDSDIKWEFQIMIEGSADDSEPAGQKMISNTQTEEEEVNSVVKEVIEENGVAIGDTIGFDGLEGKLVQLKRGDDEFKKLEKCFLTGLGTNISHGVISIHHHLSKHGIAHARSQLFEEQIKFTAIQRGDANVRRGWFGASKEGVMQIFRHGLGSCGKPSLGMAKGFGIYLAPEHCSHISVKYCDVDENDVQHMVLCRVIMGSMEQVKAGSKLFHPTCENFDSGVDDINNPRLYMIWNSNMITHVYPEYVVSFKLTPSEREYFANLNEIQGIVDLAKVDDLQATCVASPARYDQRSTLAVPPMKLPTSAWLPFSVLFEAIQPSISTSNKKLLDTLYNAFKSRKITREHLIQSLRMVVGDDLLRDILKRFQCNPTTIVQSAEKMLARKAALN